MNFEKGNKNFIFSVLVTILSLIIISLSYLGGQREIIYCVICFMIICFYIDKFYVIAFFILFLPLNDIISTTYNIYGLIGIDEVICLSIIIFFMSTKFPRHTQTEFQRISIYLILFSLLAATYINGKAAFFLESTNMTVGYTFKTLFKELLRYVPLIFIVRNIHYRPMRSYVFMGIAWSIIILCLSSLMYPQLASLGIESFPDDENKLWKHGTIVMRSPGLFGWGDVNAFAGFLVVTIGFYFARIENGAKFIRFFPLLALSTVSVFVCSSRTSMASFLMVTIIFLIRNRKNKQFLPLFIGMIFISVAFSSLITSGLSRFSDPDLKNEHVSLGRQVDPYTIGTRPWKWIYNIEYALKYPDVFLFGKTRIMPFYVDPHNYFVSILVDSGSVFLCIYLYLSFKIIRLGFRRNTRYYLFYFYLPAFCSISTVSSYGSMIFFYIFLGINVFTRDKTTSLPTKRQHKLPTKKGYTLIREH